MLFASCENKKIKNIKKLSQKKYRDISDCFLIEGDHLITEAYKAKCLKEIIVLEGYNVDNIDVEINYATENVLKYISSLDTPPKVIGICEKPKSKKLANRILMLDGIQDPGNLGTIIRSAVAFNITDIVLSEDCVDLYNSKVLRSTQGMIFNINIVRKDLYCTICDLKGLGYKIYGTRLNDAKSLKKVERFEKFAIIMGNEGNGVKNSILNECSDYICIDMNKNCESLNVGVATSIILYELDK